MDGLGTPLICTLGMAPYSVVPRSVGGGSSATRMAGELKQF